MNAESGPGAELSVSQLKGYVACSQLIRAFANNIDSGHAYRNTEMFIATGSWTVTILPDTIPAICCETPEELAAWFADRDSRVDRKTKHVLNNLTVDFISDAKVRSTSLIIVTLLSDDDPATRFLPRTFAEYADILVRGNDRCWRFAQRTATIVAGKR